MKKLLFLIILLIIPGINANINLFKNDYASGETFQADIILNYNLSKEIKIDNFKVYNSDNIKVPTPVFFTKLNDNHFFVYFKIPPTQTGNYTFSVEDIFYTENNILKETSESIPFKIVVKEDIVSISDPILVFNIEKERYKVFRLSITPNKYLDFTTESPDYISIPESFSTNTEKMIDIIIDSKNITESRLDTIQLNYGLYSYTIPVYLNKLGYIPIPKLPDTPINFTEKIPETEELLKELNLDLDYNQSREGDIHFKNVMPYTLKDLQFELTGNLNEVIRLKSKTLSELSPSSESKQHLYINENKIRQNEDFSGDLVIKNEDFSVSFPIKVRISFQEIKTEETTTTTLVKEIKNESIKPEVQEPINKKPLLLIPLIFIIIIIVFLLYLKGKSPKKTFESMVKKRSQI